MDKETLSQITPRQTVCQILDLTHQILQFLINHFQETMVSRGRIQTDGFFKGFDLNRVG